MSVVRKCICDVCLKEIDENGWHSKDDETHIKLEVGRGLTTDNKRKWIDFCDLPCFVTALNGRIENYINPEQLKKLEEQAS